MFDSYFILRLYASVLHEDILRCNIFERDIRQGIRNMAEVYAADPQCLEKNIVDRKYTNYNNPAFRCAYLHKYAALHTYIVYDIMTKILNQEILFFKNLLNSNFRLCCLGGGPGSDAVGVLVALHTAFTSLKLSSVTVIDSMEEWKYTFNLVIQHLKYSTGLGTTWNSFLNNINFNFIGADLLLKMTESVNNAINSSYLVTMVKFISAATCTNTEPMVEDVFRRMKPGALVLYIDNATSRLTQIVQRAGRKYNFKTIAGPYKYMEYSNEDLKVERFGYASCFTTKVTIILMQKPEISQYKSQSLLQPIHSRQSIPAPPLQFPQEPVQDTPKMPTRDSTKTPLRDVQNIYKIPSQTYLRKHGITMHPNNSARPSTSTNENLIRPSSNIRNPKRNNADFQSFYTQVPRRSLSTSSNSVVSSRTSPISQQQILYPDSTADSNNNGCSCCVIS